MITSGNIAAGEKLPGENDLARALHVSRTVVREALRGLAMMGIVSIRRGGGCYVTDLKAARLMAPISFALSLREYDLGGLFRAREIIDAGLAADAARNATSVHIGRLRELVAAGYRATVNPKDFGVLDREFHELIGIAAANDFLDAMARSLYGLAADTGSKVYSLTAILERSAADHQRIANAIAARDPEAARVAMRDHVIHIRDTRLAEAGAKEQPRNARTGASMALADLGDITMHYEWHGNGETVLLVSGLGGALSYWTPNLPALSKHFRLLLHDHRGTGETTRWVGEYSVELLADDLLRLMDKLVVERAHLIGHSTGGAIGQVLAAKAPDRIASLSLYATWCTLDPQMALCFDIRRKLLRRSPEDYHRAGPLFLYPPYYVRKHWRDLEAEIAATIVDAPNAEIIDARIRGILRFDGKPYLGAIRCPTLVVVAADDILTPPYSSAEVAAGIAGASLVKLPRGAHLLSRVEPDMFNDLVLDFLDANRMSRG